MDAPPWWYFYKRPTIYIDGFAEKGHRGLMQFTLVPENGPEFYNNTKTTFVTSWLISPCSGPQNIPAPSTRHSGVVGKRSSTKTARIVTGRTGTNGRIQTDEYRSTKLALIPCTHHSHSG